EQLAAIREKLLPLLARQSHLLCDDLLPALARQGIHVVDIGDVTPDERAALDAYYEREVYPVLTPLAVDPGHPFPHISNLSLSLAVVVRDREHGERFARVKIPEVLPRLVPVPTASKRGESPVYRSRKQSFVWMEQLVAAHL